MQPIQREQGLAQHHLPTLLQEPLGALLPWVMTLQCKPRSVRLGQAQTPLLCPGAGRSVVRLGGALPSLGRSQGQLGLTGIRG